VEAEEQDREAGQGGRVGDRRRARMVSEDETTQIG